MRARATVFLTLGVTAMVGLPALGHAQSPAVTRGVLRGTLSSPDTTTGVARGPVPPGATGILRGSLPPGGTAGVIQRTPAGAKVGVLQDTAWAATVPVLLSRQRMSARPSPSKSAAPAITQLLGTAPSEKTELTRKLTISVDD